jgi:hypothetical protein
LNDHQGNQRVNWIGDGFDLGLVTADLDVLHDLGVERIRAFCQLESVMALDGNQFVFDAARLDDLHAFLGAAAARQMHVILVMGSGDVARSPVDFDGRFRWPMIREIDGLATYRDAIHAYVGELRAHPNVLAWETFNEPYATLAASSGLKRSRIDADSVHLYLMTAYQAVKEADAARPVTFSDLEEEEQPKYRLFSDDARRRAYVDDCTDIYSMHVFRARVDQLFAWDSVVDRPKWCVELGSYNYRDRTGRDHGGQPAALELYDEDANSQAVQELGWALLTMGFSLVMPWSMADNPGMFVHNLDGTHSVGRLPRWMAERLAEG